MTSAQTIVANSNQSQSGGAPSSRNSLPQDVSELLSDAGNCSNVSPRSGVSEIWESVTFNVLSPLSMVDTAPVISRNHSESQFADPHECDEVFAGDTHSMRTKSVLLFFSDCAFMLRRY